MWMYIIVTLVVALIMYLGFNYQINDPSQDENWIDISHHDV